MGQRRGNGGVVKRGGHYDPRRFHSRHTPPFGKRRGMTIFWGCSLLMLERWWRKCFFSIFGGCLKGRCIFICCYHCLTLNQEITTLFAVAFDPCRNLRIYQITGSSVCERIRDVTSVSIISMSKTLLLNTSTEI